MNLLTEVAQYYAKNNCEIVHNFIIENTMIKIILYHIKK